MALSEAQREKRKSYLGSSDVAAVVGVDPFRNASDVWLDKSGRLKDRDSASKAADMGNDLEDAVLNMFERRTRISLKRSVFLTREDSGFPACANLDAGEYDGPNLRAVVEAKSTSLQDEWGDAVSAVPLRVEIQCQWQMWVGDCELAWVPVLLSQFGRFKFEVYQVERNEKLLGPVVERARWFWNHCVVEDNEPDDVPHLETLKRRSRGEIDDVISLPTEVAVAWNDLEGAKQRKVAAETDEEHYKAIVLKGLGDAAAGRLPDGRLITYKEQNGGRHCDFDLLEMELRALGQSSIYDKLVRKSRFPVLRIAKAKIRAKGMR